MWLVMVSGSSGVATHAGAAEAHVAGFLGDGVGGRGLDVAFGEEGLGYAAGVFAVLGVEAALGPVAALVDGQVLDGLLLWVRGHAAPFAGGVREAFRRLR